MKIVHISAECYPMAKAGGLADVVGALPKYQNQLGHQAMVVMPMHRTSYLISHHWDIVFKGAISLGPHTQEFTIIKERNNELGFELFCVDINGLLDRPKIYGYEDDADRFLAFQLAVIEWIAAAKLIPDIIHAHDNHAGLVPFIIQHCFQYQHLASVKTVFTIHNAEYQGWMDWSKTNFFPSYDTWKSGLLEWDHQINSLACAIKCSQKVTTVSKSYLLELMNSSNGLANLFKQEQTKCTGIINGIDYSVWNPMADDFIQFKYNEENQEEGKRKNKEWVCKKFGFDSTIPLFIFIGRLVKEKAADLLSEAISTAFERLNYKFNVLVLGSGDESIEASISNIHEKCFGYFHSQIEFNEQLSHEMYAGADFLLMPSRVEPCGLNQLYAMRYGTIPIVRRTGGLKDTVVDMGDHEGFGICFNEASIHDIVHAMERAIGLYENTHMVNMLRKKMMTINNSWEKSSQEYIDLYNSIN